MSHEQLTHTHTYTHIHTCNVQVITVNLSYFSDKPIVQKIGKKRYEIPQSHKKSYYILIVTYIPSVHRGTKHNKTLCNWDLDFVIDRYIDK